MINRFYTLLLCSVIGSTLMSCGMFRSETGAFRDRDKDYLKTGDIPKIVLPKGVSSREMAPLYPVPDIQVADEFGDEFDLVNHITPRPNNINSDEQNLGVKIQKLQGERWIFLGASTSQVWPRAQSFLSNTDVPVVRSDSREGVIETDWVQYKDDTTQKMRFRISLEKGIHADTTEVHVLEFSMPSDKKAARPFVWPERSTNEEREDWFLRKLAEHLAESIDNASASLLGQNVGGSEKAGYVQKALEPTLYIRLSPARAWATLRHAAKEGGFVTWESDEERSIIYVNYYEKLTQKRGFFKRLFTKDPKRKALEPAPYKLDMLLQHLSGALSVRDVFADKKNVAYDDALRNSRGYLLLLREAKDAMHVVIRDHRGRPLPLPEAKAKIRLLRKHLI